MWAQCFKIYIIMNWGWKIAVFMSVFIIFIMSMVISSFGNKIDLVSEDYYQKELDFQEIIDAKTNAKNIANEVDVKHTENGIELSFPETFTEKITKGTVTFFRPGNSDLDKREVLNLVNSKQQFELEKFQLGLYTVFIDFEVDGEKYHLEKSLHL